MSRLLTILLMIAALPAAAQFSEQVDVNVVLLDAIVVDRDGNQILGLGAKDFVVRENGVEQPLDGVDYFTSRRLLDSDQRQPFKIDREERLLLFFFDKPAPGGPLGDIIRARNAVRRFLDEELQPNDRAAIVGHDLRLRVYSDFTNDKQQLRRALDQVHRFGGGLGAGEGDGILRDIDGARMMNHTGTVYEAIHALSDAVRALRGRKNLILLSTGIGVPGEEPRIRGLSATPSRFYDGMLRALNAANVTVFGVNITAGPVSPSAHNTLSRMSRETSGVYFGQNESIGPALQRIETATSGYYLLAYRTHKPKGERGFQRVEVAVRNPEFRVQSRAGYAYGY